MAVDGKEKRNISEHQIIARSLRYLLPTAFPTPKTVPIRLKAHKCVIELIQSMYYLSQLILTIIKIYFTNENTKTKNILDAFVKFYYLPQKKNEDQTGNIHGYLL